jgi:hypothetical protein
MSTRAKRTKKRIQAQIEAKKPRPCIAGRVLDKNDDRSTIDRFLHTQAQRAYRTYQGLMKRKGEGVAEDWLDGQIVYWKHVTGTIEMMRAWNYPYEWRRK